MAPIEHTCPDIKKAKREIDDIFVRLENLKGVLDKLRVSNEALRAWGYKLEAENKELKKNQR